MPSHGAFLLLHGPLESGQKSEQALSLLAVCGSLNADSVLAPKGGKNYLSGYADMQKVFVRLYTNDIVADFR